MLECVGQVKMLWRHRKLILTVLQWFRKSDDSTTITTTTTLSHPDSPPPPPPPPLVLCDCPKVNRLVLAAVMGSVRANMDTRGAPIPAIDIR